MDVKMKLPVHIEGRSIIRGPLGNVTAEQVIVTGVDSDGYVCLNLQPVPTEMKNEQSLTKVGAVKAKTLTYHAFRASYGFQVTILSDDSNRVLKRRIPSNFLTQVFQKIPAEGIGFSQIRLVVKSIDALQLRAALAILELTKHVECIREANRAYYRRLKGWSLNI
ncbi:MAG: hypothetical protein ABSD41_07625 [Candidatus Bathyarchaeia archaeon]